MREREREREWYQYQSIIHMDGYLRHQSCIVIPLWFKAFWIYSSEWHSQFAELVGECSPHCIDNSKIHLRMWCLKYVFKAKNYENVQSIKYKRKYNLFYTRIFNNYSIFINKIWYKHNNQVIMQH